MNDDIFTFLCEIQMHCTLCMPDSDMRFWTYHSQLKISQSIVKKIDC